MKAIAVSLLMALVLIGLAACGGGGSSSSPVPDPIPVSPSAEALPVQDSLPADNAANVDPQTDSVVLSNLGFADLSLTLRGSCTSGVTARRNLQDLQDSTHEQLLTHRLGCANLDANQPYRVLVQGERSDASLFETELTFDTGISPAPGLAVVDSLSSPRAAVEDAFANYIAAELLADLNLPAAVEALLASALTLLFADWSNLNEPNSVYGVTSQRVRYASRQPDGNTSSELTGLVTTPDTSADFTPRDRVVLLSHATGSTPGDLEPTNAWFLLANILASHGYLVVAADNWGRGGTAAEAETYLLANRTAANSLDLLRQVLADPSYDTFRNTATPVDVTIIGYSQGGHSAVATWLMAATQAPDIAVRDVYAGAGPYNLYSTFKGVLQHLDIAAGGCDGNVYCRYVDEDTTVPFATNRVLPGFLAYTNSGLNSADIIDGNTLANSFVTGFLGTDAQGGDTQYDALKVLLQQSTFTNVANPAAVFGGNTTRMVFYHSNFDRLVPQANTAELVGLLDAQQAVEHRAEQCNSTLYETIFNLTDIVGVVHSLCGLSMVDDVIGQLR